jgi:hypothetical protein
MLINRNTFLLNSAIWEPDDSGKKDDKPPMIIGRNHLSRFFLSQKVIIHCFMKK